MSGVTNIFFRELVLGRVMDVFVDGEAGAVGEGGRGAQQRAAHTQPVRAEGAPGPRPGGRLALAGGGVLGVPGVQGRVVADQRAHT